MRAYVINLDSRPDRWSSVVSAESRLGVEILRVPAISSDQIPESSGSFVTPTVNACWLSHQKAAQLFLASSEDYGLILEDDFLLEANFTLEHLKNAEANGLDFLQLGFLKTSLGESISIALQNAWDLCLRALGDISSRVRPLKHFGEKVLVRERSGIRRNLIVNDIRAGAHAYVVSRKFAEFMTQINQPTALSTDALFISLGPMRTLRMARLRSSIVGQSDSPTSITSRFSGI